MIRDLNEGTKHWIDLVASAGVAVSGLSLATAATFMALLAALCSVVWFAIRLHDRIKYGPNVND